MMGQVVLMGSGETAPRMVAVHRKALKEAGADRVVLLDGPFGFQESADLLVEKLAAFFRSSLGVEVEVPSLRRPDEPAVRRAHLVEAVRSAKAVFAGPGSPTYALRVWRSIGLAEAAAEMVSRGGSLIMASAAALTLGRKTLPVYEIYKVGDDPHWVDGLDILGMLGLSLTVVPHWNNTEGGNHDTSRCYIGERRLRAIQGELDTPILGIDEHTAAILDFEEGTLEVSGLGAVTLRDAHGETRFPDGSTVPLDRLGGGPPAGDRVERPEAGRTVFDLIEGLPPDVREPLRRELVAGIQVRQELEGLAEWRTRVVEGMLEVRENARRRGDFEAADAIRDALSAAGIEIRDTRDGPRWSLSGGGSAAGAG
ncbi:MAG: hypothetical protein KatS3mg011_1588 [Acidimicrobiia bacterium]|nr:MAG: hypothetical protein KatS3mg011_1588 [Acidimicrobiia bacterium]